MNNVIVILVLWPFRYASHACIGSRTGSLKNWSKPMVWQVVFEPGIMGVAREDLITGKNLFVN